MLKSYGIPMDDDRDYPKYELKFKQDVSNHCVIVYWDSQ
jgi:hypothetical protein